MRGFRIELGDIEAALLRQPQRPVARWSLPLRRSAPATCSEVVAVRCAARRRAALRRPTCATRSRRELPDVHGARAFVHPARHRCPLTANGKVDRQALAAAARRCGARGPRSQPRPQAAPVEELVAATWAEVLGLAEVGRDDDFFALGGHSLLATRLLARLAAATGVELPLRELFAAPTVGALARRVEQGLRLGSAPAAPPLLPVPRDAAAALPLSFAQQRL